MTLDSSFTDKFITDAFKDSIVPTLIDYIKIPNTSPSFDESKTNDKFTNDCIKLFTKWLDLQKEKHFKSGNFKYSVICEESRTPVISIEILDDESNLDNTILMYGHLDKQPPFEGWLEGFGPYDPKIDISSGSSRLYGRGGADDGYSMFSAVTAVANLHSQLRARGEAVKHSRIVILIESSEESGSPDLPFYVESLMKQKFLTDVSLIICLDSGCCTYDSLWITTSLRGVLMANLRVDTLTEGIHSGDGSGICIDSFRILRGLLSRLENIETGEVNSSFQVDIPTHRKFETRCQVEALKDEFWKHFPIVGDPQVSTAAVVSSNKSKQTSLSVDEIYELALNRTWRPTLTVTGQEGLPSLSNAGNVLRPYTSLKLSMRLPPTLSPEVALEKLKSLVTTDPPFNVKITVEEGHAAPGWDAPKISPGLLDSLERNSRKFFDKMNAVNFMGEGGSIPFMGMLGDLFPSAQFIVTGVLGPGSNAHGPNEFLDLDFCKKLTGVISHVVMEHSSFVLKDNEALGNIAHVADKSRGSLTNSLPELSGMDPNARVSGAAEDKLISQKKAVQKY